MERNIALKLRYDGSSYHGWQTQKEDVTVQETLEHALEKVCGHQIHAVGCGRTDAGVLMALASDARRAGIARILFAEKNTSQQQNEDE